MTGVFGGFFEVMEEDRRFEDHVGVFDLLAMGEERLEERGDIHVIGEHGFYEVGSDDGSCFFEGVDDLCDLLFFIFIIEVVID